MKTKFILTVFIGVLSSAGIASAQQSEQPVIVGNSAHVRVTESTRLVSPPPGAVPSIGEIVVTKDLDVGYGSLSSGRTVRLEFVKRVVPEVQTHGLEFIPAVSRAGSRDIGDTVLISYTGLEDSGMQFFEVIIPASTREGCLASRDFSSALPVGPDRAFMTYDPAANTNTMVWNNVKNSPFPDMPSCRVLLAVSPFRTVDSADYTVWRANYGQTGQ